MTTMNKKEHLTPTEENILEVFQNIGPGDVLSKAEMVYHADISIRSLERFITRMKRFQTPLVWWMDVLGIEYLKGVMDNRMYFVKDAALELP